MVPLPLTLLYHSELVALQKAKTEEAQILYRMNANDSSRLVQSPERIKRSIHDMAAHAESTKPQIAHYDATARVLQAKLDYLHDFRNVPSTSLSSLISS